MDERSVVEQVLKGDLAAYKKIVDAYQNLVGHVVFRLISNRSDQQDICQDVFVKIYENLKSFKFESKLSTWIASIAYNTCVNFLQKKKAPLYGEMMPSGDEDWKENVEHQFTESFWDKASGLDTEMMKRDASDILKTTIDSLPPQYKTVITLFHVEEMNYEEIGSILQIPAGTVKSHLFRARKILKDKLLSTYTQEELWA